MLTKETKRILQKIGEKPNYFRQIEEAEKFLIVREQGVWKSKAAVRAEIGETAYWAAVDRAAFHGTASGGEDGKYTFDCSNYFRS